MSARARDQNLPRCDRLPVMIALMLAVTTGVAAQDSGGWDSGVWAHYGGDAGGRRYSDLAQVDRTNVAQLEVAWVARTGELGEGARDGADLTFEATPVVFADLILVTTGFSDVLALDPASGEERWRYRAAVPRERSYAEVTTRGIATWTDSSAQGAAPCRRRVYVATIDARLLAIDAERGLACGAFGTEGAVDLAADVGMTGNGDYQVTSPPAVVGDLVVVGSSIGDNWSAATADGRVRAYDARSGALRWSWSPLPFQRSGDLRLGAANAWAPIAADVERGLVFVPTSSPSPDFFGGLRPGDNRDANSLVALDVASGRPRWSFQVVHHDLWDFDLGAQPTLVELQRDGGTVAAVAQATKMGLLYLLDRATGEPLHPVEERAVPTSDVPGEHAARTQPFPLRPRPLVPPEGAPSAERVWGLSESDRQDCRELLQGARSEGPFTPPSLRGTVLWPGNSGGTRWGGIAWQPTRGLLIVPSVHLATLVQLMPRSEMAAARRAGDGEWEYGMQGGAPFGMRRRELSSRRGVPCSPPPWGP
ncbi:MAG TPA: PQQ-binding-like beta-propeller repeat protein [Thermoanaerobaculia bacterium]|nr:PQQ-binding-like beta-propeller repeat protein [Thermoanaerobaculia bacterium]